MKCGPALRAKAGEIISNLTLTAKQPWSFVGRVLCRDAVKDYSTPRGNGNCSGFELLIRRNGKDVPKRDLRIVDDSDMKGLSTAWSTLARKTDDAYKGGVAGIKDAFLCAYNGLRSIDIGVGIMLLHQPGFERSEHLRSWYGVFLPNATLLRCCVDTESASTTLSGFDACTPYFIFDLFA